MSTVYSKSVDERIKYFFILKVYVFFEALMEPVDLTWFKLYLKKKKQTNKQTKVNANSGSAESVIVKGILKRQKNQRKEWNSTRDGVLPTPKQNKRKQKQTKKQNKTLA